MTPGDPAGIENLTRREREVLLLIETGATNRLISQTLGISERTVKAHFASIMKKTGVTSRSQAAVFACELPPDTTKGDLTRPSVRS
ncbi:response regulator transcription factor [Streptomyces albus]|uniref:response regulator transcription factor n=1 Tax=Streptomyces sp. NRRL F-5639 TaxID=1463867 RepID=UPI001F371C8A|nr:helix-turn-helix transcriptional regulator [Streptomyces sp. NRRL F-5639]